MDHLMVALRLVHVVSAVLWVGIMFFTVFFLMPAVQEAGPEGGKVMKALAGRGLMTFVPVVALTTVITGVWLYWRASMGFDLDWIHSATGETFALGGFSAIIAYVLGITIVRPSMMRSATIMQSLSGVTDDAERERKVSEAERLRTRSRVAGRVVAGLLLFSTAAMAVARYL